VSHAGEMPVQRSDADTPATSEFVRRQIALIAVDLDGTLLQSDSSLSPEGGDALVAAARRGIRVIVTTTRNIDSVRRFAAELGLTEPVICTNGAMILGSPGGPVWHRRLIPGALAETLAAVADVEGYCLITTVGEVSYTRQQEGQSLGEMRPGRWVIARNAEALASGDPIRILNYDPEGIPHLRRICDSQFAGQAHVETYFRPDGSVKSLGVFAAGSDKGTALQLVSKRLGIDPSQVMAIGDNPNDLPMFACAGIRVAMGNATGDVKAAATVVAPTNDDAGVAWAVRRYVLRDGDQDVKAR
jgi:Cof subfamily protein (haloacid dehalogenase superfamily)